MKQSHTPTPWVIGVKQNFEVRSQDLNGAGDYVGEMYSHSDAAHIVRCVNVHDKLVAALQNIVQSVPNGRNRFAMHLQDIASAVLAEIEGRS